MLSLFGRKRETRSFRTKTLHMCWTFSSVSFSLSMLLCLLNRLFISPFVNLSTFGKQLVSKVVLFLILTTLCFLRSISLFTYLIPNIIWCPGHIFSCMSLILKTFSSLMYVCKIWYAVRSFFSAYMLVYTPFQNTFYHCPELYLKCACFSLFLWCLHSQTPWLSLKCLIWIVDLCPCKPHFCLKWF